MGKMHVSQLKFEIAALSELLKTPENRCFLLLYVECS